MKYVISSGKSVVSSIDANSCICSKNASEAMQFDTIGEAMKVTITVNDFFKSYNFRVLPVTSNP